MYIQHSPVLNWAFVYPRRLAGVRARVHINTNINMFRLLFVRVQTSSGGGKRSISVYCRRQVTDLGRKVEE